MIKKGLRIWPFIHEFSQQVSLVIHTSIASIVHTDGFKIHIYSIVSYNILRSQHTSWKSSVYPYTYTHVTCFNSPGSLRELRAIILQMDNCIFNTIGVILLLSLKLDWLKFNCLVLNYLSECVITLCDMSTFDWFSRKHTLTFSCQAYLLYSLMLSYYF